MGLTNKDFKSRYLTSTSSPLHKRFRVGKIRFKTEVCSCSNFPTETMLWIKEVSRDGYFSGRFKIFAIYSRSTPFPDFELLDARSASSLNKIIQNSYFKKKVSLEEQTARKADRFLRGRQIAYLIYDYFRVLASTMPYSIMPTCLRLFFGMIMFRNLIQDGTKFYYPWNNSHLMIFSKVCAN